MNRTHDFARFAFLALGLALVVPACDEDVPKAPPTPVVAKPQPTAEAALERSRSFWADVQKGDWVPTYDMLTPEAQQERPVTAYLQSKANHKYENMRVEEVVAQKDNKIFVRVSGLWTPTHPIAKKVKLEPGQSLTSPFSMVEVWRWETDRWLLETRLRPEEFVEQYPELRQGGEAARSAEQAPAEKH